MLRSDSWEGYPWSMASLMHHIVTQGIRNVVFLSGDEHLFCMARAEISLKGATARHVIHSIHSSPLYAPFPFANSIPAMFPKKDRFAFEFAGLEFECRVAAIVLPVKEGFTEIRAYERPAGWKLDVGFHDSDPATAPLWVPIVF